MENALMAVEQNFVTSKKINGSRRPSWSSQEVENRISNVTDAEQRDLSIHNKRKAGSLEIKSKRAFEKVKNSEELRSFSGEYYFGNNPSYTDRIAINILSWANHSQVKYVMDLFQSEISCMNLHEIGFFLFISYLSTDPEFKPIHPFYKSFFEKFQERWKDLSPSPMKSICDGSYLLKRDKSFRYQNCCLCDGKINREGRNEGGLMLVDQKGKELEGLHVSDCCSNNAYLLKDVGTIMNILPKNISEINKMLRFLKGLLSYAFSSSKKNGADLRDLVDKIHETAFSFNLIRKSSYFSKFSIKSIHYERKKNDEELDLKGRVFSVISEPYGFSSYAEFVKSNEDYDDIEVHEFWMAETKHSLEIAFVLVFESLKSKGVDVFLDEEKIEEVSFVSTSIKKKISDIRSMNEQRFIDPAGLFPDRLIEIDSEFGENGISNSLPYNIIAIKTASQIYELDFSSVFSSNPEESLSKNPMKMPYVLRKGRIEYLKSRREEIFSPEIVSDHLKDVENMRDDDYSGAERKFYSIQETIDLAVLVTDSFSKKHIEKSYFDGDEIDGSESSSEEEEEEETEDDQQDEQKEKISF